MQQLTNKGISKSGWWLAMTAALWRDGNTTATVMDCNGRCDGNATATMVMERSGNGGGAPKSNGHHSGMLSHYGRAPMHLELLSFGYKYGAPPHRL